MTADCAGERLAQEPASTCPGQEIVLRDQPEVSLVQETAFRCQSQVPSFRKPFPGVSRRFPCLGKPLAGLRNQQSSTGNRLPGHQTTPRDTSHLSKSERPWPTRETRLWVGWASRLPEGASRAIHPDALRFGHASKHPQVPRRDARHGKRDAHPTQRPIAGRRRVPFRGRRARTGEVSLSGARVFPPSYHLSIEKEPTRQRDAHRRPLAKVVRDFSRSRRCHGLAD